MTFYQKKYAMNSADIDILQVKNDTCVGKLANSWLAEISPSPSIRPHKFPSKSLCGFTDNKRGWIEPKRVIYDYELILIQAGVYRIELEAKSYECAAGTYFIVPPSEWHCTTCDEDGRRWYSHFSWEKSKSRPAEAPIMTFHPADPKPAFMSEVPTVIPTRVLHGVIASPVVVFDLMNRLNLMLKNPSPHERLASRGVLLELLIRLLDRQPRKDGVVHREEELAHKVRDILDDFMTKPTEQTKIRDLLGKAGQSYEHLSRCFRKQYGLTPVNYIQSIRIERAKSLLRQTDFTITAVANEVGYEDAVYFSRLFKTYTGMTPGRFRED